MGGLANLFKKIIPIITLICFVCFGITTAIKTQNNVQLTYLTEEYYNKTTFEKINNPTQQEKQNAEKFYHFDMVEYANNLDINIITTATQNVIDIEAYKNTSAKITGLWTNGYQIGDITKTILNAIILVIDTLIVAINIAFLPLRLIAGILLTAMSLIGINISKGIVLIPFLKIVLNNFAIPLISSTTEQANYNNALSNTTWTWKTVQDSWFPEWKFFGVNTKGININFTSNDMNFWQIVLKTNGFGQHSIIYYEANKNFGHTNNAYTVYKNGWYNNAYKTITIKGNNYNNSELTTATNWLNQYMTQQNRNIEQQKAITYKISNKKEYYLQYC